ncbi:MAG: TetR/AcrR family transcriptional regulator [Ruminococcus sp.]|nr:TetR/AcrR family transcriptional regulator [Ruminococcus sp.]
MGNELNQDKDKRNEAIEASVKLFLEHGISDVKMTDIAEKCGIGVAALYRYFDTKTGIAIEAMTYLWNELRNMFSGIFESDIFLRQSGLKQVTDLMRMFLVLYEAHPSFMKLLSEFDLLMITERVSKDELKEYDKSVINFYPIIEKSFMAGIADETIREDVDFKLFYVSYAHALMAVSQKLIRGEILPSDDFSAGAKELEMLIESASYYLRKN